jgi:hypothetical protein
VLSGGPYTVASQARHVQVAVYAAVSEARLMADKHSTGTKFVAVGASRGWVGDPLPGCGLYELAQHNETSRTNSGFGVGGTRRPAADRR